MKVGDLVVSRRSRKGYVYLVLKVPPRLDQIQLQMVETGNIGWLNKQAFEVVSASR